MSLAGLESRKRERKGARTQSRKDLELQAVALRLRGLASLRFQSWHPTSYGVTDV